MLKVLLQSARLPFLVLTPACVLLGAALASEGDTPVSANWLVMVIVGALAAHISVNAFNEYFDYRSGLDFKTTKTPFSGGSGALVAQPDEAQPDAARAVLILAIIMLLLTVGIGSFFIYQQGAIILLPGLLGVAVVLTYTPWLNCYPWLCLISPGLGFGLLMVMGCYIALTGQMDNRVVWASLPIFFLVNNLLLLNQFPDIEPDRSVGRRTFPGVFGWYQATSMYGLMALLAILSLLTAILLNQLPAWSLLAVVVMLPSGYIFFNLRRSTDIPALLPDMGINVAISVLTPLILASTVYFS